MKVIALIILTLCFLFALLVYVCFRITCVRGKSADYTSGKLPQNHPLRPFANVLKEAGDKLDGENKQTLEILSFDGLKLYADYIPSKGSRKTVIMMHGYHSTYKNDFSLSVPFYRSLGFNVLLADQRCHSRSEGRYITYGIREKYDCRDWVLKVLEEFGEDTEILLAGVSMGASTVLMTAGLDLPENVKAISADCGFTSGYDIVKNTAKSVNKHIPDFVIDTVNFCCRIFANFDLKDDNTLSAMQKAKVPIFFAHGTRDTFVPCEMTLRNYATCRSEKELLTVAGAEHGMSYLIDRELYEKSLTSFLEKYFTN